jgi:hypothetical protein
LIRNGRLVEIMFKWRFRAFDLSMVHPGNRHVSRPVGVFKELAAHMARTLFPSLRSQGEILAGAVDQEFSRGVGNRGATNISEIGKGIPDFPR